MLIAGRYEIGAEIGSGGSGSVYRGVDLRLQRDVAIKVIPAASRRTTERQLAEIRAMAAATGHRSVVALYDALLPSDEDRGTDGAGHAVLVMELVDGPSLSTVLADGPLPLGVVRGLGVNLAAALTHLHEQGIVHRDLKPANVLLAPDGQAKLADFGISRIGVAAAITSTGFMIGTAGYLSPEQVEGNGAGPDSDVYSLGLVLLEALTGRREFVGTPTEAALARLARQPALPADLPADVHLLLCAMLARDRAARPSAAEAGRALAAADLRGAPAAGAQPAAAAAATGTATTDRLPVAGSASGGAPASRGVRGRVLAGLAAAAALAGLLGAGQLMSDDGPVGTAPATVVGGSGSSSPDGAGQLQLSTSGAGGPAAATSAAGTSPTVTVPTGTVPTGTVPTGTVPTGTVPTGTVPTGTVPTGTAGDQAPGPSASGPGQGDPSAVPTQPSAEEPASNGSPTATTKAVPPGSTRGNSSTAPGQTRNARQD